MANAGMHALVGVLTKNAARTRTWLFLGVVLGNMFPDLDNYAVDVATLTGGDTHGLHARSRTASSPSPSGSFTWSA